MPAKCELLHIAKAICKQNAYEFILFLDAGVFKETYKIKVAGRCFALKVFRANNTSERTEREIDAMQRLRCKSIANLFTVNTIHVDGKTYLFLVEEYLRVAHWVRSLKHLHYPKMKRTTLGTI